MTETDTKLTFLEEFPPVSTEDWEAKIQEDLKGADYEKKLIWKTIDGFKLRPYYRQEDLVDKSYLHAQPGSYPYLRGNGDKKGWNIQQDIWVESLAEANAKALNALSKGASSICFIILETIHSPDDLQLLLEDIDISSTMVHFKISQDHYRFVEWLVQYLKDTSIETDQIQGSINICPLSKLTASGNFYTKQEDDFKFLAGIIKKYGQAFPNFQFIPIEGHLFVESGASVSQELGFSLAIATDYLAFLTEQGLTVDEIAPQIQFNFGIGSNYFLEIAKIRAARLLWSKIVKVYGASSDDISKVKIHSSTSSWNKTLYDPYVNMLRLTTEAMSAVIGGCDSLSVQPFDEVYGYTSDFAERIARNTQIILKEEAQLDKTIDPAAGSYYIENVTDVLAGETWRLFQQIEHKGGYTNQFLAGDIQDKIKGTVRKRDLNIAMRKEVLLGTNQYPNSSEKLRNATKGDRFRKFYNEAANMLCKPLKIYRGAEAFETLRMKTDQLTKRPKVFLFTIGNLNWRKARASFASGFFACAGYEIIDNPGFESIEDGVEAARKSRADIVVICSSDDEYTEIATPIYQHLKDKAVVVVAGMPACAEDLKQEGIENFIHIKSNVLELLQEYHKKLGIK